ncbi:sulfite exporter TauE/SafE family protein [Piscinibacter sakaiensis]|uniref:Probable membrane transporter protein n=1 Tax=Piscinibacter sakaiensis TaxID=1547922 RepID=A0A0K8P4F3_PISS1|nr:sulfite exporter TauE/SafE family protein [Piscinibacter sakaiensis]GAP37486.1 hypothetical protein ISF6_3341 [Piscinibacter sakaiensis]
MIEVGGAAFAGSAGVLAATAAIVALAYTVYGLTGFGSSIVAVPLLAQFYPLRFVVPMVLLFDLAAGLILGLRNRHRLSRAELLRLLPWLCVGMVAGVTLLVQVPERVLLGALGAFTLLFALWSLLNRRPVRPVSARWAAPAGLAGGAVTALYGTGGPIYTLYLARRLDDAAVFRATIGVLIFVTAAIRLALFSGTGLYAQPGLLALALAMAPAALAGFLLGSRLHARLDRAQAMRVVWSLLIVSGTGLLVRALGG